MAEPDDVIGRFAVDDSYFRASDLSVKHRAFLPAGDGCTSVFIISNLNHAEIVAHGAEHVAPGRGKPIRGYVKVEARFVLENALSISDDVPPPLHANILGWSGDIDAAKLQAMTIAENASFVRAEV